MKILLITEVFPPKTGGSGRWFFEVYRRLPRAQVCIAAGEDPRQAEFDATHDLRLVRLPLTFRSWGVLDGKGLGHYWRLASTLASRAKAEAVDEIHCGRCLPEGLIALALKIRLGTPYLCYAHGEELSYAHHSRELRWLMRRVFRHTDLVIANSRNTARLLCDEWALPPERVCLLYPGVDTQRFFPASPDPAFRQALGWTDRRVVLTVGRLQKRKGHDMMIRALPALRCAIPDVLYVIVGDGEERAALQRLVEEQGVGEAVQFLGEPDDRQLIRCYQQCDLFVLPNRQVGEDIEGFGMVLLEAQACGKPVLAGASGGTAETMQVPETGRLVECTGPEKVGAVVADLLTNARQRDLMGRAARAWTVDQFDWATLSRRAVELFQLQQRGSVAARVCPLDIRAGSLERPQ